MPLLVGLAALAILMTLLCPPSALAQMQVRKPKKVLVLQPRVLPPSCDQLFAPQPHDVTRWNRMHKALETALGTYEDVVVLSFGEFRSNMGKRDDYREKSVLGREFFLLGQEEYKELRQAEAQRHLQRSVNLLDSVLYEFVEPEALSQILLLLGVTQVEVGEMGQAHINLRRALSIWPQTSVVKGYYPTAVERAISTACEDLLHTHATNPTVLWESAAAIFQITKADTLFVILPGRNPGSDADSVGHQFELVAVDREPRAITFRDSLTLTPDPTQDQQLMSASASRWAACTPFSTLQTATTKEARSWTLAGAYQQMAYMATPTRDPIFNWGFSFSGSHFFLPTFGIMGKLQFFSSVPDRYGDLLDEIRSVRLVAGPAFALSGDWWRLFVLTAAEAHTFGSFRTSRDPDCKFYQPDSPGYNAMCEPSRINQFDFAVQGGFYLALGSQLYFANQLFIEVSASFSAYFLPINRSLELNFPVGLEVGGGISF